MPRARKTTLLAVLALLAFGVGWVIRGSLDREDGILWPDPPGWVFELTVQEDRKGWKRTMNFLDGDYGLVQQKGRVYNRGSQLDYHWYNTGSFTVGIQGGERGVLSDLGSLEELTSGRTVSDLFRDARWRNDELLVGGKPVWNPDGKATHAQVRIGHVYVAVIYRGHPDLDVAALLVVLEHERGRRVKYRWCLL